MQELSERTNPEHLRVQTQQQPKKSTARLLWALFSLFVVYGTTFPFSFRNDRHFSYYTNRINWGMFSSIPDMVQNVLLFLPFGFLGYFSLIHKSSRLRKLAIVVMGGSLSATVEFLQMFSPERYPAKADVEFNTLGTIVGLLLGIVLKKFVLEFKSHPNARRFLDAHSAFPAFVFLILTVVGCWEPFNFSLEIGSMWGHIKPILQQPLSFSFPNIDVFEFIQFVLATLFTCRLLAEAKWPKPAFVGVVGMVGIGFALEATQVIIVSRAPEFEDAVVAGMGALAGGVLFLFPGFRVRPWLWSSASFFAILLSALVMGLHPFHFNSARTPFNWVPLLPQYEKTTANALGELIANAMLYFPLGFLFGYFFPNSKRALWFAIFVAGAMSMTVETLQGFVTDHFSDITNVLGSMLGAAVGGLVLTRGWSAFTAYMREDSDKEV